jgi:peroxiredoxin Q/BCP
MQMQAGDVVTNFTLQNQDGVSVSLSDYAAEPVVLFFYPRADTPGCTLESCGFRDIFAKFKKAGIVVLGISRDTVAKQKKFKDKYELPYDLLADPEMVLIKRYDLLKEKKMYGKPVTGVERTTYVIAPDTGKGQRLLHVFPKVTPAGHAEARALSAAEVQCGAKSSGGKEVAMREGSAIVRRCGCGGAGAGGGRLAYASVWPTSQLSSGGR